MYDSGKQLVFSPGDLTVYLQSEFASWMDHLAVLDPAMKKFRDAEDAMMALLGEQGEAHEHHYLYTLQANGYAVTNIRKADNPEAATREAMTAGDEVIYQAHLGAGNLKGQADFLIRVPGSSALGDYAYTVRDAKLSRTLRPAFIIQLCAYAEMLAAVQGSLPEQVAVVLGNQELVPLQTRDYFYYYQRVKQAFFDFHRHFSADQMPDPFLYSSYGQWSAYAEQLLVQQDHLLQVADMTRKQVQRLYQAGIYTMQALAETSLAEVRGIQSSTFARLQAQAALQHQYRHCAEPGYQLREHPPGVETGLAMLPPHSPNDVFFDIEGDPLVEGGLEYLWGNVYFGDQGERCFKDFWAHDAHQEKQSFQAFINWIYQRWQQDPTMHVYHYASYEMTAIRKLMQRYGVCELEVDELLRNRVFVDLYKIVKKGMLISERGYSIKNVEHLYRGSRRTEVGSGDDSVVVYERWRAQPDGLDWSTSRLLQELREYNRDDCESTQELVAWLRERQYAHDIAYIPPEVSNTRNKRRDKQIEKQQIRQKIVQPEEDDCLTAEQEVMSLLEHLSGFHERERKPEAWLFFERLQADEQTLYEDLNTLSVCRVPAAEMDEDEDDPVDALENADRNKAMYVFEYDQDEPFRGDAYQYRVTEAIDNQGKPVIGEVVHHQEGVLYLAMKVPSEIEPVTSLIPFNFINTETIESRIIEHALNCRNHLQSRNCLTDLLMKRLPDISGIQPGQPIIPPDTREMIPAVTEAVTRLNNSYLVIQGPPGTGKTYTAKYVIASLLQAGKRIGISSNSHKAIHNLLGSTAVVARQRGINVSFTVTRPMEQAPVEDIGCTTNRNLAREIPKAGACVVGTTVWGFARAEMQKQLDYLFIDEAGQVALANYVAMSGCADNIVLLGDQMQLSQPTQAVHPAGSGVSVLDYILQDQPTIPPHQGIFLATSYRMHSAITQFISQTFYESRLKADPANDNQHLVLLEERYKEDFQYGIVYCPLTHYHNSQSSQQEVSWICQLTGHLLEGYFIDKQQQSRPLQLSDILYVAPFNHQVQQLQYALGEQARVGSVDKFQGQQAPVVIISMCSSSIEESPRGIGFLFDRHRLNVAVSRAQALAVIVASDRLSQSHVTTMEQLPLMNTYCRLIDEARLIQG